MNSIFLRDNKSIKSINLIYFILCIPLILFGFYKNGILLYIKNCGSILDMFIPLVIPFIFYYIAYLIVWQKYKKKRVNEYSLIPIYGMFIGMLLPVNSNMLINLIAFIIITYIFVFVIKNKLSINYIAFSLLAIILINYFLYDHNILNMFINSYESKSTVQYSISKQLFGFNYSGIASSNIILIGLFALFAYLFAIYKYEIPIYLLLYLLVITIFFQLFNISYKFEDYFNYSIFFIIFLVSNYTLSSPITIKGKLIYCILFSILFIVFSFLPLIINILVCIILCGLLSKKFDIMLQKS